MLVFLQLLEVDERGFVVGIELQHVGERRDRAIDESAAAVVEAEAEQHVRVLDAVEPRPLQQRLVFLNRAADLALLAVQVAEHQPQLERARIEPRRLLEFFDGEIDLAGDEVVEAEDEVRRLPDAAAIDPAALDELVALPRLAGGQPDEQRDQDAEERCRSPASLSPGSAATSASHWPCARRMQLDQFAHRAAAARRTG